MRKTHKNHDPAIFFLLPFLTLFLAFSILPLALGVYNTFFQSNEFVGIAQYRAVLSSAAFCTAIRNTLLFLAVGVPLALITALVLALILQHQFAGASFFRAAFLFPLTVPVSTTVLLINTFFSDNGIVSELLQKVNIDAPNWLHSGWAFVLLLLLYLWKNLGYNIILMIAGLSAIPAELSEAASIDGAGPFRCFFHITLPLLTPRLAFVGLIAAANSFKMFREAYLIGGDIPDESIYMLQHFLNNNFSTGQYGRLSVAALLLFSIVAVVVSFLLQWIERKLVEQI